MSELQQHLGEEAHEIDSRVVADSNDPRDVVYVATSSAPLPDIYELDHYRELSDETWHQRGEECTGFALAAIANFLIRRNDGEANQPSVSRRMLYEMAQKYDQAMHVEGSTLRGALKGWSRVGVANDALWPYHPNDELGTVHGGLTLGRILDARRRPLLSYQRIEGQRVSTMKRALLDGHPLYVAAQTHVGWYRLFLRGSNQSIERRADDKVRGIHAFVIVGFNEDGFVLQNSWGPEWGDEGYATLPYDQWNWGATDAWVAHAGIKPAVSISNAAPIDDLATTEVVTDHARSASAKQSYRDMWQHLVVLDDDGQLASTGRYEMDEGSIKTMLYLFDEYTKVHEWPERRLVVVSDGGAHPTSLTIEQLQSLRDELLQAHIYPFFVVWETSFKHDLDDELQTWSSHRRSDNNPPDLTVKIAAAESRCRAAWNALVERSHKACHSPTGGARVLTKWIAYKRRQKFFDLHVVSTGVGDLLQTHLATILPTPVMSAVTIGATTTLRDFEATYGDMLSDGCLQQVTAIVDPTVGADDGHDSADLYLSLFTQVWSLDESIMRQAARNARRTKTWAPAPTPVLGLARSIDDDPSIDQLRRAGVFQVMAVNTAPSDTHVFAESRLRDQVIATLTSHVSDPATAVTALSRDPLERAARQLLTHESQPATPAAIVSRDPLVNAAERSQT